MFHIIWAILFIIKLWCSLTKLMFIANSDAARVPSALGQEIFLCPSQQKLQSLKWKIHAKSAKEAKAEHTYILVIFSSLRGNKTH